MAEVRLHEKLTRDDDIRGPSDRRFGLTLAVVGLLIAIFRLWRGQGGVWWWVTAAASLAALALFRPSVLAPLNRLWLRLGLVLNRIVNPLVMGLIFFTAILPTGLLMRAWGKDPLRLRREPKAASYWIARESSDPPSESMKQQF